jgi:hypothetical protein
MPNTTHPRGTVNADSTIMLARGFALLGFCRFSLCASLEHLMLVKAEPLHLTYEVTQGDR